MQCPRCQHENPSGVKFCGECGARIELLCLSCRTANPLTNKFCNECGAALHGEPAVAKFVSPQTYTPKHLAEKILSAKTSLEGERKQVTVLFADMKGSMELLADRDPEEARKILDPVIEYMMEAVHRYEGTVSNLMGDGIMALFGAPLAHEDHAVRACYAALRMQESVKGYAEGIRRTEGVPIQIRVGLNSGEVVVGAIGNDLKMDYTAVGQTTHLAARMEQMAAPGSIMITADGLRLAEGYVQVKPIGPVKVRGLSDPVEVYEVEGAGPARSRLEAAARRGLTRFVGRDAEMQALRYALEQTGSGRGQVVAVVGEPGVGKSRLYWEFIHSHRAQGWLILKSSSVSYGKATAYFPIVDLIKTYFKIQDRDDHRVMREKVTGKLLTLDEALKPSLPAFLTLLEVAVDDAAWQGLDPPHKRRQIFDAVKRLLLRESQIQPLILLFEDLHWIDSETQAVLDGLVESLPTARLLLLANYRPEYQHGWGNKTYYTQLRLDPLLPESAGELLQALLGDDPDHEPLKQLLIARTEGNPFFIEESVRTLVETNVLIGELGKFRPARALEDIEMPATVQAILAARIDRLSAEEKRLLQCASVIGEEVPLNLLEAIAEVPAETFHKGLAVLQAAEFLYETQLFPEQRYTFKHGLTYQVTYNSLLHERRRVLHTRVAEAIERLYSDHVAEKVELLAHHTHRGEVWDKATSYLHQAGRKAAARSAYKEAVEYFNQALEALEHLPENVRKLEQAIDVRLDLGPVLSTIKGYSSPEVEQTYLEARELCDRLGVTTKLFPVLWMLARVHNFRGELKPSRDLGEQLLSAAQRSRDPALLLEAHHTLWATLFTLGEFPGAQAHCEQGIALYDPRQHGRHAFLYGGHDPGVCSRTHAARQLWMLGYPNQALRRIEEGLILGRELSHPFSLSQALYWCGWLHQQRGEWQAALERIEAVVTLGRQHDIPRWVAGGGFLKGRLLFQQGRGEEGIEQMRESMAANLMILAGREKLFFVAELAESYGERGDAEAGLQLIAQALARVRETGEGYYEAEMHRINGELLLPPGVWSPASRVQEAEGCFQKAIEVARSQRAKSLELRAVTCLSRLWQKQGKKAEARRQLAEIYGWFTEGFETADLKAAKALLDELS